jgi:hypothetical protein
LSSFVFGLGLVLPSVIGGVGIFLLGMRLRLWWRVAAATLNALLAACGGVLAIDTVLGALNGGAGGALIGIGFVGALSFVLFVVALQAVVGLPGTALAAFAFVLVGNAVSGGSVPVGFSPGGVIGAVDLTHLSERRHRPHNTHEIYRTPAVVHVSRRSELGPSRPSTRPTCRLPTTGPHPELPARRGPVTTNCHDVA